MLIWHVHRKSCLAIDDDWFYRSNIYRPYISPPEYIVSWLSLGHSFLPKALWKEKYYQQQQSWWENMSPGSHQTAFPGVTLIMRLRTSDTGLGRTRPGIAKRQKPTTAPCGAICDISIVNTKFLNEDDGHMIFLPLFLCSWSLSCNRKVFPPPLWVRDGVVQLPSWRASCRPEIVLECKILSFSRTSRTRMHFWKT